MTDIKTDTDMLERKRWLSDRLRSESGTPTFAVGDLVRVTTHEDYSQELTQAITLADGAPCKVTDVFNTSKQGHPFTRYGIARVDGVSQDCDKYDLDFFMLYEVSLSLV